MRLCGQSVKVEMDRFFKSLMEHPEQAEAISKSAFTQARKKLKHEAFIALADHQRNFYYERAPYQKSWLGHRLVAVDGSTAVLPKSDDLVKKFGYLDPSAQSKTVMANISTAYDVMNQLVIDAQIEPYGTSEHDMLLDHAHRLSKGDIAVMDRGYGSAWVMGMLLERKVDFCIRLSRSWKDAALLMEQGPSDIDWCPPTEKSHKKMADQRPASPIIQPLRLVCIDVEPGKRVVLATSLTDRAKYPVERISELYHLRWQVEESYKTLKHVLELEHFSGKSELAVKQDFYARVFVANMASMVSSQLAHEGINQRNAKPRKHGVQLNRLQALAKLRDCMVALLNLCNLTAILVGLRRQLLSCLECIRPNRKVPRPKMVKPRKYQGYKGI